jgi:hypothetical protein
MDARTTELLSIVSAATSARTQWINSDSTYVTEVFESEIEELITGFRQGDIPAPTRKILEQVARLKIHWEEWQDRAMRTGDATELPGNDFWLVMDEIENSHQRIMDPPKRKPLETIAELEKQEVSDYQICLIYEWMDAQGTPEYWKLKEERDEPGKHINDDFVDPAVTQRELRKREQGHITAERNAKLKAKLEASNRESPETVEELIEQGITARQISLMKNIPVIEINKIADDAGLEHPAVDYPHVNQLRGLHDSEPDDVHKRILDAMTPGNPDVGGEPVVPPAEAYVAAELVDNFGESESNLGDTHSGQLAATMLEEADGESVEIGLEANIIMLHHSGEKNGAIAEELSTDDHPVSIQRVNGVLRRYKNDPTQFIEVT